MWVGICTYYFATKTVFSLQLRPYLRLSWFGLGSIWLNPCINNIFSHWKMFRQQFWLSTTFYSTQFQMLFFPPNVPKIIFNWFSVTSFNPNIVFVLPSFLLVTTVSRITCFIIDFPLKSITHCFQPKNSCFDVTVEKKHTIKTR